MAIKKEELEELFTEYAKEDINSALSLITGLYVGVNELVVSMDKNYTEGSEKKTINITGSYRDITIHAVDV